MDNLEFRQITEIDKDNLDIMTNWMYKWWGQEEGYTFDGIKCFLQHSFQKDRLPKTYGLFHNERINGYCMKESVDELKEIAEKEFESVSELVSEVMENLNE